jgi:molybdate transport system substrate-binding protein
MRSLISAAVLLALMLASCAKEVRPLPKETVPVLSVAASTKDAVEALIEEFKLEAKINLGPSNGLATQILEGAPADLFLSANEQWADEVKKGGQAVESTRLLTNRLVLIVPKGNPGQVHEPKDLLAAGVKKIALAGEDVPAGKYADQSLTKLDLRKQLESKIVRGQDVRMALAYVERGEAEAGIVYSTDVGIAPGVESVYTFDPSMHDEIVYVLVLLKHGKDNPGAHELYQALQSEKANEIYSKFGFSRIK